MELESGGREKGVTATEAARNGAAFAPWRLWIGALLRRGTSIEVRRVGRPPVAVLGAALVISALWGQVVDASVIPVLAPTGGSTIFQATTAAPFALMGIFFGPLAGALGGVIRDGTVFVLTVLVHPGMLSQPDFAIRLAHEITDVLEDVVLGWVPGLVAVRVRRLDLLLVVTAAATWLSLPFRTIFDLLINGQPELIWGTLTTRPGDWNEPADPALLVYALVTAALVGLGVAWWTNRPRAALLLALVFGAGATLLLALGVQP